MLPYVPLIVICLSSLIIGVFSANAYTRSYLVLQNVKIYVNNVEVFANTTYVISINFSVYNPSDGELKIAYIKPLIYLNLINVELEEPSFIKYPSGNELPILAHKNVTILLQKRIKSIYFPQIYNSTEQKLWTFNVYISLKGVPLLDFATLNRYVRYLQSGSV